MKKTGFLTAAIAVLLLGALGSADVARAIDSGSICDHVKIDIDRNEIIRILNDNNAKYKTESLSHLYEQREPQSGEPTIPEFLMASYPREVIFGSTKDTQGRDIAFILGVSVGERIGAVACTRIVSP